MNVTSKLREAIRNVFWQMHEAAAGRAILEQGQIKKIVRVEDRDYDPIREMERVADQVIWSFFLKHYPSFFNTLRGSSVRADVQAQTTD
jgi:hypothetical protein